MNLHYIIIIILVVLYFYFFNVHEYFNVLSYNSDIKQDNENYVITDTSVFKNINYNDNGDFNISNYKIYNKNISFPLNNTFKDFLNAKLNNNSMIIYEDLSNVYINDNNEYIFNTKIYDTKSFTSTLMICKIKMIANNITDVYCKIDKTNSSVYNLTTPIDILQPDYYIIDKLSPITL